MYQKGRLITNPDYQRDFVYNNEKSSKLIESALMGIPLPTIYLCEEENGKLSVIDGQQRIQSFIKFINGEFCLEKLSSLSELNGKKYSDLSDEDQSTIDDTSLRTIIIKKESASSKYDIFERLNRGAVSLKEQELRNCVYRGSYNDLLNDLAKSKKVRDMFVSKNKRMNYQELILRFFALRNYQTFNGSMKKFLNNYMDVHQNDSDSKIKQDKDLFNKTLSTISEVLGLKAFYNLDFDKKTYSQKFSPTFYDSLMIPFSMFDESKIMANADKIRENITNLKENDSEYHLACYAGTGNKERVFTRIEKVYEILKSILGTDGFQKEPRLFEKNMKEKLGEKQNYICPICNQKIINIEDAKIDHIKPFSKGGLTTEDNAQLTHSLCNLKKSDKELNNK